MFDTNDSVALETGDVIGKEELDNVSESVEIPTIGATDAEELISETQSETILDDVDVTSALGLSGLGFGVVCIVLVVLMAFITVMSAILRGGKKEKNPKKKVEVKKEAPVPAPAQKAEPAPVAVKGDADMYVSLNGKKHAVSVEEKLPRFTVTLNGKTHGVDVENAEEE